MKILAATIASLGLVAASMAHGEQMKTTSAPTPDDIRNVAPALEKYRSETVSGDLWKRSGLAPRDRSIVTLAALIARDQETEMAAQLNEAAEANRAERVGATYAAVSQGTVDYTTSILFRDPWLRPDLAPRDRSLVTVSALIASGQSEQVPFHLNKAMDNGLTRAEAGEMLTQLAFYAGWPKVFSAMPVAKKVFEGRTQ